MTYNFKRNKYLKLVLYSIIFLFLSNCAVSQKANSSATNMDNKEVVITFKTGACLGTCPIYTLTIDGKTNTATYQGQKFTNKLGLYSKPITESELTQLVTAFETAKFNSMKEEYLGSITDFPIKFITYTNHGKTKTIKERYEATPKELIDLETMLHTFSETEGWTKVEEKK